MTTRVTAIPADPWDLIPAAVRAFVALNGIYPTRVRIDRGTEAVLAEAFDKARPMACHPFRGYEILCGLHVEWDEADREDNEARRIKASVALRAVLKESK